MIAHDLICLARSSCKAGPAGPQPQVLTIPIQEHFTFSTTPTVEQLTVTLFSEDLLGTRELLAMASVPLWQVITERHQSVTAALTPVTLSDTSGTSGSLRPEVALQMSFQPGASAAAAAAMQQQQQQIYMQQQQLYPQQQQQQLQQQQPASSNPFAWGSDQYPLGMYPPTSSTTPAAAYTPGTSDTMGVTSANTSSGRATVTGYIESWGAPAAAAPLAQNPWQHNLNQQHQQQQQQVGWAGSTPSFSSHPTAYAAAAGVTAAGVNSGSLAAVNSVPASPYPVDLFNLQYNGAQGLSNPPNPSHTQAPAAATAAAGGAGGGGGAATAGRWGPTSSSNWQSSSINTYNSSSSTYGAAAAAITPYPPGPSGSSKPYHSNATAGAGSGTSESYGGYTGYSPQSQQQPAGAGVGAASHTYGPPPPGYPQTNGGAGVQGYNQQGAPAGVYGGPGFSGAPAGYPQGYHPQQQQQQQQQPGAVRPSKPMFGGIGGALLAGAAGALMLDALF